MVGRCFKYILVASVLHLSNIHHTLTVTGHRTGCREDHEAPDVLAASWSVHCGRKTLTSHLPNKQWPRGSGVRAKICVTGEERMVQAKSTSRARALSPGRPGEHLSSEQFREGEQLELGHVGLHGRQPCQAGPTATIRNWVFALRVMGNH